MLASWGLEVASINYDLMTFDDALRDGSSFDKPCTSAFSIHAKQRALLLVILKHTGWFSKVKLCYIKYSKLEAKISALACRFFRVYREKKTPRDWQNGQNLHCCSLVLAYSFYRSWLQSTLPSIQFWLRWTLNYLWPLEPLIKLIKILPMNSPHAD